MSTTDANDYIQLINRLDLQKNENLYIIAKTLTSLHDLKMHEAMGYDSFNAMVRAELSFSHSLARRYVTLFNLFTAYRYTKRQATTLLCEHSVKDLIEALTNAGHKLESGAINTHLSSTTIRYLGLYISESDNRRIEKALSRHGMIHSAHGRRTNLTNAMLALIEDYESLLKQTGRNRQKESA